MELSNMIKESEWFCAIEGIAIAERIYNIYEDVSKVKQSGLKAQKAHSPRQRPTLYTHL